MKTLVKQLFFLVAFVTIAGYSFSETTLANSVNSVTQEAKPSKHKGHAASREKAVKKEVKKQKHDGNHNEKTAKKRGETSSQADKKNATTKKK